MGKTSTMCTRMKAHTSPCRVNTAWKTGVKYRSKLLKCKTESISKKTISSASMMTTIVMIRSFHFCRHVLAKNKVAKEGYAISMINPEIFREYDIRGIADRDLTSPVIEALGRAFAEYLKSLSVNTVTVGFDARLSSSRLCDDVVRGLTAEGMQVIVLGLCPTPALYFSLFHLKPGAGVMITGSHNPSEFNGFKLCVGKDTIYGEEIQKLRYIMTANEGKKKLALEKSKAGGFSRRPILPD